MARYHWWGFIVNEAGEPIENAEITIKLAGTEELACVYYDEFGNANSCLNPELSAGPQLSTLSNGYYEFWIGDISEPYGYRNDQKFKIEWIRIGVAQGMIDYVNIFPLGPQTYPVSFNNCVSPSMERNKLVSDYLACKWDSHSDHNIVTESGDFSPIHGIEFVDVESLDTVPNKIINNYYGFHWEYHRLSTVQDYHPSAGRPHGMEEVNPLDGSSILRNKLVSNRDLYNLHGRITDLNVYVNNQDANLQLQIDDLLYITDQSKSGWWTVYAEDWIYDEYDKWYVDIEHDLEIYYPIVICWDELTKRVIQPTNIEFIDMNTIRITIENENLPDDPDKQLAVRIANGGVHRHP
jgi:hypothetical protein